MQIAWWKANDMAMQDYCRHVTPGGLWPNEMVRGNGADLPVWYEDNSNQVESLACGPRTYQEAIDILFASTHHHNHMAGIGFWSDHARYGVGYGHNPDSKFKHHWVVITTPAPIREHWQWLPVISKGVITPEGE